MVAETALDTSHLRDVSAAAAETGAIARHGLDPSLPVGWNIKGDYFYQFDDPTGLKPPKEFTDDALSKRVKEDEAKKKRIPSPTSASPAPPELIPDDSKAIAVCLSPDVCRSPEKPVPYMSWGKASDDQELFAERSVERQGHQTPGFQVFLLLWRRAGRRLGLQIQHRRRRRRTSHLIRHRAGEWYLGSASRRPLHVEQRQHRRRIRPC
nr:DUF4150 domain-containing protein [Sinorhizobium sojae]